MILRALESEYAAQTGRRLEHCALRVKVRKKKGREGGSETMSCVCVCVSCVCVSKDPPPPSRLPPIIPTHGSPPTTPILHVLLLLQEWAADLRVVALANAHRRQAVVVPLPRLGQHHMEVCRFVGVCVYV